MNRTKIHLGAGGKAPVVQDILRLIKTGTLEFQDRHATKRGPENKTRASRLVPLHTPADFDCCVKVGGHPLITVRAAGARMVWS